MPARRTKGWIARPQKSAFWDYTPECKNKSCTSWKGFKKKKKIWNIDIFLNLLKSIMHFSVSSGRFWYKNQVTSLQFKKKVHALGGLRILEWAFQDLPDFKGAAGQLETWCYLRNVNRVARKRGTFSAFPKRFLKVSNGFPAPVPTFQCVLKRRCLNESPGRASWTYPADSSSFRFCWKQKGAIQGLLRSKFSRHQQEAPNIGWQILWLILILGPPQLFILCHTSYMFSHIIMPLYIGISIIHI